MIRLAKLACPLAIATALSFASVPAKAQFGGMDESQMQQFAPMLEMMKQKMGKRQFGQLMQTMGPMMERMQSQGGFSSMMGGGGLGGFGGGGNFGGFGGGGIPMMGGGGMDIGQIMSMVGSMKGLMGGRHGRHRRHRG